MSRGQGWNVKRRGSARSIGETQRGWEISPI